MPFTSLNTDDYQERSVRCTTKMSLTFDQTWSIEDVHCMCGDSLTGFPVLKSEPFAAPKKIAGSGKDPICFELSLYPKGTNAQSAEFIGLFLKLRNSSVDLYCKYWFSIVDAKGDQRCTTWSFKLFKSGMDWGMNELVRRADLLDPAKGFLHESDKLVIHCKVAIYKCEQELKLGPTLDPAVQSVPLEKSMAVLLDSGAHSDVVLVMVNDGGKELRAHKAILATRCRVFADMFQSRMAESVTNRVEIVETRVEVFKQVLHFIYTGKVERTSLDGIAKELLICADKYQLDPLKSICEEYLVASGVITTESDLSDLLALTILPESPKLQAKVLELLRKKFEAQLSNVDKMKQLNRFLSSLVIDKED